MTWAILRFLRKYALQKLNITNTQDLGSQAKQSIQISKLSKLFLFYGQYRVSMVFRPVVGFVPEAIAQSLPSS